MWESIYQVTSVISGVILSISIIGLVFYFGEKFDRRNGEGASCFLISLIVVIGSLILTPISYFMKQPKGPIEVEKQ